MGKKIAYAIVKVKTAFLGGTALAPMFSDIVEQINGITQPIGISIHVDKIQFEKMLPFLLLSGLVAAHDWVKIKFQDKPVAKFL